MKKKFKMENLDCANCARKMADGINKIEGCISCNINFMAQKITIEAEEADFARVLGEAEKVVKNIHSNTRIVEA